MHHFGIDLGTTNTVVYWTKWDTGENNMDCFPVTILYENTADVIGIQPINSMPSVLYGREKPNGSYDIFLGDIAKILTQGGNTFPLVNTKCLMSCDDQNAIIAYGLRPIDIATEFLKGCYYSIDQLKAGHRALLREDTRVCLTQPAAFNMFASIQTQDAGRNAGFKNVDPLSEPSAALLSFLYDCLENDAERRALFKRQQDRGGRLLTLVIDIGGGTTDVTIQELTVTGQEKASGDCATGYSVRFLNQTWDQGKNDAPHAAANPYERFGGLDFDVEAVKHIMPRLQAAYQETYGGDFDALSESRIRGIQAAAMLQAEDFKKILSTKPEETYEGQIRVSTGDVTLACKVNAAEYYEWVAPLCETPVGDETNKLSIYGIISETLRRSGYNVKDIDYIYVTGGMSSLRSIRNMLNDKFKAVNERGDLRFSKHPLFDVARGAALYRAYFLADIPQTNLFADIMLDDPCGLPQVIAKAGEALPTGGALENFAMITNPVYFDIALLSGFGPTDPKLRKMKTFRACGYPPTPIGTLVDIRYKISAEQRMNIDLIVHHPNGDYEVPVQRMIDVKKT